MVNKEAHYCCEICEKDLAEFFAKPENQLPDDADLESVLPGISGDF